VTPGHEQLRDCIARGLDAASERLAASSATGSRLQLRAVRLGSLADLDPDALAGSVSADRIAGVVQRFEGQLCGTALLALDPGDALQWLRAGGDDDPLDRFVLLGGQVLCAVVEELARACDAAVQFGSSLLEERPLMAALLSTHAPSDTALLSLTGEIEFPGAAADPVRAAYTIQLLLDPKLLDGVLLRLSDPS
jgi:hypothetical protein